MWAGSASASSASTYASIPGGSSTIAAGTIDEELFDALVNILTKVVGEAARRCGSCRTAARGRQGNQWTPAMFEALLKDARTVFTKARQQHSAAGGLQDHRWTPATLEALVQDVAEALLKDEPSTPHVPRGGFTDVGLHTGGKRRDTVWPLVRVVFQVALTCQPCGYVSDYTRGLGPEKLGVLYDLVMADFHLHLLEQRIPRLSGTARDLNEGMKMLQSSVQLASTLTDNGHDMLKFVERVRAARQGLEALAANFMMEDADRFNLRQSSGDSGTNAFAQGDVTLPSVVLPSTLKRTEAGDVDLDTVRRRSKINLAGLPRLEQDQSRLLTAKTLDDIIGWIGSTPWDGDLANQLLLAEVESLLFTTASSGSIDAAAMTIDVDHIVKLKGLVASYKRALEQFSGGVFRMSVELFSRETLVCWIAYAVVFAATRKKLWPREMESFGVCLRAADLQHMVLADKLAVEAARKLADYLHSQTRPGSEVFCLADGGEATFSLAGKVARASRELHGLWASEQKAAKGRREAHWATVIWQQRKLIQLRNELGDLEARLAYRKKVLEEAKEAMECRKQYSGYRKACRSHTGSCECQRCLAYKEASDAFNETEKAIAPIVEAIRINERLEPILQPLPEDETTALRVLFFMHMPMEFRTLSHLSFQAQQMLLGRKWISDDAVTAAVERPSLTLWSTFYNNHRPAQPGLDHSVALGYSGELGEPETMVDRCACPSDGVWHPDSLAPGSMLWKGGGSFSEGNVQELCFDPFSRGILSEWTTRAFTEQLPGQDQPLQWAMPQYGIGKSSRDRGNLAIVNQSVAPDWLGKQQFLVFGAVRAYPLIQQRKLVMTLRDRSLPLGQPAVRSLVSQALYHIGELSSAPPTTLLWRSDQGEVFAALVDELQVRIAEIAQTPREHEAVLLLADMAVYVSHWNDECKNLVRSCLVKVPQEWARDLDDQVQDAAANRLGEEVIPALRAKQCTFHMYGVLCYGGSDDLSTGDIANMCKLQMLAHNRELYAGGVAGLDKGNLSLKVRSLNVMARRSSQIAQLGKSDPSFITAAVKLVLGDIPPCVSWVPVDGTTACFEAQHDGHLYSTNLLTGAVLLDGEPPGWLPIDITQDDLYLRVFRKTRFEVVRVSNGVFKTTRATKGRRYEFSLRTGGGELVIMEIDEEPRETLELLRHNGAWAEDLPVRCRTMHIHWLCRDKRAIVFRPTDFSLREVDFIATCSNSDGGPTSCYRVPRHLRSCGWKELLDKTEDYTGNGIGLGGELVLVKEDNAVFSTLAKFENRAVGPSAVIHAYLRPDGVLDIDLPRFGLSFRVDPSSPRQNRAGDRASGITCVGHDGYQLACDQQLQDTLPGLTRYLVLVREEETMVLVPRGKMVVREGKTSRVWIECDNEECEHSELQVFSYMLHHRWQQLDAGGLSARLQLAAMYAATSTSLPDPRAGMTGTEKALELIRRCPANHPLQEGDGRQVLSVIDMSGGTPALAILCGDLLESSRSLDFLHPAGRSASCSGEGPYALEDAMTAYTSECLIGEYNARRRLSDAEEVRIMGIQVRGHQSLWHEPAVKAGLVDLQSCPISAQLVQEEEDAVRETKEDLTIPTSWKEPERPYPLEVPQGDILAADLHAELRSSWKAHQLSLGTLSSLDLTKVRSLHERFAKRRGRVESLRKVAEKFVLDALVDFGSSDERAISYGMQRLAGLVPTAAAQDLPPFQWSTERARMFNPFLSEEATSGLIVAVALWLRLCVLEDKLGRLQRWTGASGAEALVWQEMQVTRTWNPTEHPKWLAFEAESGLQIRPAQAEVALHMMNNPGEIVQLNMGEGKTRVILPLLVLHWSVPSGDAAVVRLHFVEALLGEAFDYLHHVLSGTLLECPVFLLPFNRDVILTLDRAQAMRGCLERCRRVGGAVLVTPEHRQSLYLKGLELIKVAPAVSDEINRLQGMSFRDVFDESDELFHHRKQLVYAVGGLQTLPALEGRVVAVQALLRVLKHRNRFPKLARLLSEPDVAVEETSVRLERFEPLRLLLGPALDAIKHDLHAALLDAVFTKPPYEMLWVSNLEETMRVKVVTVVLNEVADAEQTLGKSALVDDTHWQQVLALRGLLAHGTLLHCLQMRPRVNYGVSRPAGAKKRMAVPFRASNTPADRSEFRQPDVAIVYTVLSYYYDGLSPDEFRQVLTMLLEKVAESAQKDIYNMWLAEVQVEKEEHRVKIEDVFRVDPTNDPQMDLLYHYFAHNFEVVNSWLRFAVFPAETKLCPKYIGANAWFLANNETGETCGFSGTNDNHLLMPLQVRKSSDQRLPSLSSTNGKMLDLMMLTERYVTLEVPTTDRARARPLEVWKMLLNLAVKEGAHALVDSGALLGSISGQEAAVFLLSPEGGLSNEFRGVVFFDPDQGTAAIGNGWMVLDRVGRYAALAESGLNAAEAFSIYDEARCRGADLKLSPEATALLTIGPGNMKDKVMQAAGRLRLLGRSNQSVVFVGTPDVSTKIGEVAGLSSRERITARDVLGYVMANTVEATRSGLLAWARQGLDFSVTFGRPQRAEHDEVLTLDAAYGAGHRLFPVDKMVRQAVEKISRHKGDVHMPELSKDILSRTGRYGKTVIVSRDSALGGECEREMDLALEEEEEVEREVPKRTPRQETDWEYATALAVESLDQLLATVKVQITPLAEAWGGRLSADAQMSSVRSSSAHRVYCTLNFMLAVEVKTHDAPLDDYLRPVDAALSFANGDVVLLSEREADGILLATSKSSSQPVPPVGTRPSCTGSKLIHLSYTISELDEPRLEKNPLMRATKRQTEVPLVPRPTEVANAALEMVWVFGGWTTVPKHAKDAVKTLVKGGRHAVTHIVAVRGHAHMLPRSDLERLLT